MNRPVAATVCVLVLASTTSVSAQSADDFFNPDVLQDVRLLVNERDLEQLRASYQANTYYPADFHWGGQRVRNVGIRSRGNGSRNPQKLGLRVDFNRYVTGQSFLGKKSIVLDNLWQDPSMIREVAALALFARLGQPAPRESFARVFINDRYEGLYALVEAVDNSFLDRTFGDSSGVLFEYRWQAPYWFEDLGNGLAPYQVLWEAETHKNDAPSVLHGPIQEMTRAINHEVDAAWRIDVERYVDLPQVVTHAAIEAFLAEKDGLAGEWGVNNVYLYRLPGSQIHRVLPWDRDNAFQDVDAPIFARVGSHRLLAGALAFADLRALYLAVLERCATVSAEGGWLEGVVSRSAELIDAAVKADGRKPYDDAAYATEVAGLVSFARRRPGWVLAEVARSAATASR
ncbi:MAG TPA: CotH kinase family protein [Vicinamibacterales bacterium]